MLITARCECPIHAQASPRMSGFHSAEGRSKGAAETTDLPSSKPPQTQPQATIPTHPTRPLTAEPAKPDTPPHPPPSKPPHPPAPPTAPSPSPAAPPPRTAPTPREASPHKRSSAPPRTPHPQPPHSPVPPAAGAHGSRNLHRHLPFVPHRHPQPTLPKPPRRQRHRTHTLPPNTPTPNTIPPNLRISTCGEAYRRPNQTRPHPQRSERPPCIALVFLACHPRRGPASPAPSPPCQPPNPTNSPPPNHLPLAHHPHPSPYNGASPSHSPTRERAHPFHPQPPANQLSIRNQTHPRPQNRL